MSPRSSSLGRSVSATLALATLVIAILFATPTAYASESHTLSALLSNAYEETVAMQKSEALVDESRAGDFYFAQGASGRCTITSIAMMLRRAAFLDDASGWQDVTLSSVMADGWTAAGAKNEFSSAGYDVSFIGVDGSAQALVELLEEHPEGVAIYDRGVPHAVLLTDYDEQTGTFYCADPADYYSGKRIPIAESWNGACHGNSQDAVMAGISAAWVVR